MDISFKTKKLQKCCNSSREACKTWGAINGGLVMLRLTQLAAAYTLADMRALPAARLHPLEGNRKGQWAVDVQHPFRLLLAPDHDPVPQLKDGGVDLENVTAVIILGVEDYHG